MGWIGMWPPTDKSMGWRRFLNWDQSKKYFTGFQTDKHEFS